MQNHHIPLITCCAAVLLLSACKGDPALRICQMSPMTKVMFYDSVFVDTPDTACVARGESAVFQFVVTTEADSVSSLGTSAVVKGIGEARTGWVHDVHSVYHTRECDDAIQSPGDIYPDPIIDDADETVEAGGHRTVIADFDIPRTAAAGLHKGRLSVEGIKDGRKVHLTKDICIQVYPVALPEEQSLKVVNWLSPASFHYMDTVTTPMDINSERYFGHLRTIARTAALYGQNCWLVDRFPDVRLNSDSSDFVLDFTYYDKVIETLRECGNLKYFCNAHFGYHKDNPAPGVRYNLRFNMVEVKDKQLVRKSVPCQDPALKDYIDKYYSQIEKHFRERGWLDICYQHVADEPDIKGTQSAADYSATAGMVKAAAPGLRIIDASEEIMENQDVSVVVLGPSIDTLPPVPAGTERWLYTCCGPKKNFANRFVELPLIKTRIIHWLNYRYNECGYLHWGYNFWEFSDDPMHEICNPAKPNWPGGDCFIIYPGQDKVYPSIRLLAMRDGIRDYDLLKMIEDIDPQKAMEFCCRVVKAGDRYDTDATRFYALRKEMLEYLSR